MDIEAEDAAIRAGLADGDAKRMALFKLSLRGAQQRGNLDARATNLKIDCRASLTMTA